MELNYDSTSSSHLFVFTNTKAGMNNITLNKKKEINKLIYEASKDSIFFQHSIEQDKKVSERILKMKQELDTLTKTQLTRYKNTINTIVNEVDKKIKSNYLFNQIYLVVDMDMFYAAVEMRDNPNLINQPLAVGNMHMICTTNYHARKYGVRAAMPGFIGKKLCPQLIFVKPNHKKYMKIAQLTRDIYGTYDKNFSSMGLDEAVLNITEYYEKNKEKYDYKNKENKCEELNEIYTEKEKIIINIQDEIRNKIFERTKLTCSVGIAYNKMLAKICSDINKPNGKYLLPFNENSIKTFLLSLPIRKIGGIGKVFEKILMSFDIVTCKDILEKCYLLFHIFTEKTAKWLLYIALGVDGTETTSKEDLKADLVQKSISKEKTFSACNNTTILENILRELSDEISMELQNKSLAGKTITLKFKCVNFSVKTRSISLKRTITQSKDIFSYAKEIWKKELPLNLRLIGLRISALEDISKSIKLKNGDLIGKIKCNTSQGNDFYSNKSMDEGIYDDFILNNTNGKSPCPICGYLLDIKKNKILNDHIDKCLDQNPIHITNSVDASLHTSRIRKSKTLIGSARKTQTRITGYLFNLKSQR